MPAAAEKLPREIKALIASYCSPPATLASLAVVQRAFQVEAERNMYASIAVTNSKPFERDRVYETLAVNQRKAGYVRFLQVDAFLSCSQDKFIASILPTLVSIKDLRLKFNDEFTNVREDGTFSGIGKEVSEILRSQCFQRLETLFCDERLHISEIVKCQKSLQNLGIYGSGEMTIRDLEQLRAECHVPLPMIFCLTSHWSHHNGYIALFPTFLPPASAHYMAYEALKPVLADDRRSPPLGWDTILRVTLYFETLHGTEDYVAEWISGATEVFANTRLLILLERRTTEPVRDSLSFLAFGFISMIPTNLP
ncbi:hypothetical protein H0H92_015388 [Tricholoma furcatifolium]|nr:hypothetical protein H0H92_015388 [Tricholoma furcatifolium]